ncbi:hypothetical protein ACDP63_03945 [Paracoccus sp. P2]|uniref:hypothetical protein n=1 Tax=Paracoccus sp. P2 TaxID=3248840 RepID=UPI00391F35C4
MTACLIHDVVPLGSLVEYSDGTPQPPARFTRKLAAWKQSNGRGRLVEKQPPQVRPNYTFPPSFTLHVGDFGERGTIVLTIRRTFNLDSALRFRVIERPRAGQARVVQDSRGGIELLHLAEDRAAAEAWLATSGYSRGRIEEVTAQDATTEEIGAAAAGGDTA